MNIITIGKKLIPAGQIALVEAFDPASNPEFKSEKAFKSRIVLLNRDTVLAEMTPQQFAEANGFYVLAGDNVAVHPDLGFRVETFAPTESFKPGREFKTRIKWRDADGNEQSKLLVSEPEMVITELTQRSSAKGATDKRPPQRPSRARRGSRPAVAPRSR